MRFKNNEGIHNHHELGTMFAKIAHSLLESGGYQSERAMYDYDFPPGYYVNRICPGLKHEHILNIGINT